VRLDLDAPPEAPRVLDLAEFVRERVAQAIVLADAKRIELEVDAPERSEAKLDVEAFAAVLDNLLDNAIKYAPVGSHVHITLKRDDQGALELSILDQGPGVPSALRESVFERFTRLHDDGHGGAGLGLSIVRRAASRLGGQVELGDDDGRGLRATLRTAGPVTAPNQERCS
jgi:two-component system, OmpR family, sensor histidine kinase QseC